jgi:hypothetical protein
MNIKTVAEEAIRESSISGDICHIYDKTGNYTGLRRSLEMACEDWTDANPDENGNPIFEYWGQDDDGDGWVVHVHVNPAN